ncbi:MAG: glutamate formimidoyltransferase [Deltaproteobacteria bacterium]|nr:glutamate formimidoyltransferase [Deltaproteobacteria bacterium]
MSGLVEVVPNFSEGRNESIIREITRAIESVESVVLLDVDPGGATNRTVVTFVGEPAAAVEAAFEAARKAFELIDMSKHKGAHPRMGAMDVCPFVPVSGLSMEEAIESARKLGKRIGDELDVPVYLYEEAATRKAFKDLARVRAGEYEGLAARDFDDPDFSPDFGPRRFIPGRGACAVGAREFLVAYNIDINTRDAKIAREIALNIRQRGRWARDDHGKIIRDHMGNKVRKPGIFRHCKAVGWYIAEYGRAQVTINLTDYKVTSMHHVFEEVRRQARNYGARVTGSEVVGLLPLEAMLSAGRFYLLGQGKSPALPDRDLVQVARMSLGLDDVAPFDPHKKIVEWRVAAKGGFKDTAMSDILDAFSRDTPFPGGGSAAALCGSLSAALSSMVANLTYGHSKTSDQEKEILAGLAGSAQELKYRLMELVEEDSKAYEGVISAMKIKAKSEQEKAEKVKAIEKAMTKAYMVPLEVLRSCLSLADIALQCKQHGIHSSLSDSGVAAVTALASARGAFLNIMINLKELEKGEAKDKIREEALADLKHVEAVVNQVWTDCLDELEGNVKDG